MPHSEVRTHLHQSWLHSQSNIGKGKHRPPELFDSIRKQSMTQKILSYSETLVRRFIYLVLYEDFQYSELQSGLVEILWGFWIMIPRLTAYTTGIKFLREFANPKIVSVAMVSCGLFHLWALLGQHYRWRKLASLFSMGVWGFLAILLGQIAPAGLAFPSAVVFALGSMWGLWRLKSGHEDGS